MAASPARTLLQTRRRAWPDRDRAHSRCPVELAYAPVQPRLAALIFSLGLPTTVRATTGRRPVAGSGCGKHEVVVLGEFGANPSAQFMPSNYRQVTGRNLIAMDGFLHTYHGQGLDWQQIHQRASRSDASIPPYGFRPERGDLQYWASGGQGPMSVLAFTGERDRLRIAGDTETTPHGLLIMSSDPSPSVRRAVEANPRWSEAKALAAQHGIPISSPPQVSPSPGGQQQTSGGGCYIATAVYGSYDAPEVLVLRHFRDTSLARTAIGRAGIRFYYAVSPAIARRLGRNQPLSDFSRRVLNRLVRRLDSSDD